MNSTPSSISASTAEPELTAQTEEVPDKAVTSVSAVQSIDSLSTITTVVEVHKSTDTETHSSKVNNTESQCLSDSTQSATDHPSVSTEANVFVKTKTVEKCINTPKHTIKPQADTADVQLKSARIPVSSKQTENSEKIESVWDLPLSSYVEQCSDFVEDEVVEIESVCSDMSETMSQVSIDTESKLSPSVFKRLLAELKGSKKPIEKCLEYTDDI